MKYKILLLALLTVCVNLKAQDLKKSLKTIEVVGTAEQEVIPDEIYVHIILKEYKKGNQKVSMNTLEEQLVDAVKGLGLPSENLSVENVYGYNWNWKKRRANDFLATKTFKLLLNDVSIINDLIDRLGEQAVNTIRIDHYDHSQIEKLKADLKVKAIKAAKQKAKNLVNAIGEELGVAIEISELDQGVVYSSRSFDKERLQSNYAFGNGESKYTSDLGFKKIKLEASIRVVFSIK